MIPKLQVALDTPELTDALRVTKAVVDEVDVIEVGTILLLHQGLQAVREIRAIAPEETILADVRIAEAGSIIAEACFAAGANWVSCVAGASLTTIRSVVEVALAHSGEVQVELSDEWFDLDRAREWRDAGVRHAIVKRSRDGESAGASSDTATSVWSADTLERIHSLDEMGFVVTVTGGITAATLDRFAGHPVGIVIAGREIASAPDPAASAAGLRRRLGEVFGA